MAGLLLAFLGACDSIGLGSNDVLSCRADHIGDGDSLRAHCRGRAYEVRLYCIDAPELDQRPWGRRSRDYLRRIMPEIIEMQVIETDGYGRRVSLVRDVKTGESLNLALVTAGQAAVYRRYCRDAAFYAAEEDARQQRRGIWARPGRHQRPWEYRHR